MVTIIGFIDWDTWNLDYSSNGNIKCDMRWKLGSYGEVYIIYIYVYVHTHIYIYMCVYRTYNCNKG